MRLHQVLRVNARHPLQTVHILGVDAPDATLQLQKPEEAVRLQL